ncbi:MAG: transposase family protein [Planctomycetes bacterium]|nr:transposase family protein [Planctomycetota bacterium]
MLELQGLWVTGLRFDDEEMITRVRGRRRTRRCPLCGTQKSGWHSTSTRRWRHLGVWGHMVWIEAEISRLRCGPCGKVVTGDVDWARHGSDFTRALEEGVALGLSEARR